MVNPSNAANAAKEWRPRPDSSMPPAVERDVLLHGPVVEFSSGPQTSDAGWLERDRRQHPECMKPASVVEVVDPLIGHHGDVGLDEGLGCLHRLVVEVTGGKGLFESADVEAGQLQQHREVPWSIGAVGVHLDLEIGMLRPKGADGLEVVAGRDLEFDPSEPRINQVGHPLAQILERCQSDRRSRRNCGARDTERGGQTLALGPQPQVGQRHLQTGRGHWMRRVPGQRRPVRPRRGLPGRARRTRPEPTRWCRSVGSGRNTHPIR